jgi:Ca2+/Na+ antiporter
MLAVAVSSTPDIVFLFAGAGLVLYVASRAAVDALTSASEPSPGKLALGHWIPIAAGALLATGAGRPEIGIGLTFATSVAALGMVLGVLTCISNDVAGPSEHGNAWPFVVPAAVLALLAGFSGSLTWWHALMLLGLGACVMSVWIGRHRDDDVPQVAKRAPTATAAPVGGFEIRPTPTEQPPASAPPATTPPQPEAPPRVAGVWRVIQFVLAVALSIAGGWLAYRATTVADDRTRVATGGLIAAAVVSPLLVLPMLGTGAIAAHHGRLSSAVAGIVGVVLLNLCALLPLVILTAYARQVVLDWDKFQPAVAATTAATTEPAETLEQLRPVPFPLAVWRVDTALLIVFGLLLIPISLGRLTLRKPEGLALAVLYAIYLVISTALAIRL